MTVQLKVNLLNGEVCCNDSNISLQNEQEFLTSLSNIDDLVCLKYNGFNKYYLDVTFLSQPFSMGVAFFNNQISHKSIGLIWQSGRTHEKGYESSIKDIERDIMLLAKIIEDKLLITPSKTTSNSKTYKFNWGNIFCGGALKTPTVSISISYKDY